jgi:hypothetical protein
VYLRSLVLSEESFVCSLCWAKCIPSIQQAIWISSNLLTEFIFLFSGKALCIAFAQKGLFVTVVDFSEENGREVAMLVQKENSKFHRDLRVPSSMFVKCDVSNAGKGFIPLKFN